MDHPEFPSPSLPHWVGDLNDDCTAHWMGLTLRAEWMQVRRWWWAVYDDASQQQVAASHADSQSLLSGRTARERAVKAAREYLGLADDG